MVRLCSEHSHVQIHLSSVTLSKSLSIILSELPLRCCEANNSTFLTELLKGSNEKKKNCPGLSTAPGKKITAHLHLLSIKNNSNSGSCYLVGAQQMPCILYMYHLM